MFKHHIFESVKNNFKKMKPWLKKLLIVGLLFAAILVGAVWYIFNEKFTDTNKREAAYTVDAMAFLKEFQTNDTAANKKYTEKIITVNGNVAEIEESDSLVNVKMIDTTTQAYIIFAFQQEQAAKAKALKEGDKVSIKGSCSGGIYSDILESETINFKRCVITNNE
jgi:hypothetical protein